MPLFVELEINGTLKNVFCYRDYTTGDIVIPSPTDAESIDILKFEDLISEFIDQDMHNVINSMQDTWKVPDEAMSDLESQMNNKPQYKDKMQDYGRQIKY